MYLFASVRKLTCGFVNFESVDSVSILTCYEHEISTVCDCEAAWNAALNVFVSH